VTPRIPALVIRAACFGVLGLSLTHLGVAAVAPGQTAYGQACLACHGATLDGTQFGPPLRGTVYLSHWQDQPAAALDEKIRTTMPPGKLGTVSSDDYSQIEVYLRQANGQEVTGAASTSSPPAAAAAKEGQSGASMMGRLKPNEADPQYLARIQSRKQLLSGLTPVSDEMLQRPPAADWLSWRRGLDGLGYSPLRQINRANVGLLRVAWSWTLPPSTNEITPLVHDGVMFIYSGAAIQALDAASGDLLWQYVRTPPSGFSAAAASHGKSLAVYQDRVFAPTADGHVVALGAKDGRILWDQEVLPTAKTAFGVAAAGGLALNSAPIVVRGTVILGASLGTSYPGGCFIVGLDALTGQERWRFHTIAQPGQPGADSWNGAPVQERYGGGVWTGGSYDPDLDLVYFGIGNTYDAATLLEPRPGMKSVGNNDGLYTDSTVALRPATGALVWYFQHQNRDVWDLDWVFEQSLITLTINGHPEKLVVTAGKTGLFDAVDAATGKFVFSSDSGVQNIVMAVDPISGAKRINPELEPLPGKTRFMCPNSVGARNWMASAVNPDSSIVFLPILENCADYTYAPRSAEQTAQGGLDIRFAPRVPPNHDGNFGRLTALDLKAKKVLWTHRQRLPFASSILATAGGLIFAGDIDRYFNAFDQSSGKLLWRSRLSASPESFPVTFAVNGRQFVAVVAGSGSPMGAASRSYAPEVATAAAGVSVTAFELP
jgi:alcohol dehydrogenase (cytochrome c)